MKRPGGPEDDDPDGGRAEKRRRQFEDSRGLEGRRELELGEEALEEDEELVERPAEDADEGSAP